MSARDESTPARVADYVLERRIGLGGGGVVYAARHEPTGACVALKVLHAAWPAAGVVGATERGSRLVPRGEGLASAPLAIGATAGNLSRDAQTWVPVRDAANDAESAGPHALALARCEREARLAMTLDHPHIVRALSSGRLDGGGFFLAMQLLEGEDLRTRIARGRLPATLVRKIGIHVCEALAHVHALGIVHRDLKPANLFLCEPHDDTKVLDFGVARWHDEARLTRRGDMLGTWAYASPEQARGDADIDGRSDVWSLGVVLYEALTGTLPFWAEASSGVLYRILMEPHVPLARCAPWVPASLASVIEGALRKQRDARPASAAAMADALRLIDEADLLRADTEALLSTDEGVRSPPTPVTDRSETREVRLVTVACVRAPNDSGLADEMARAHRGRSLPFADGTHVVLFGADGWHGDECDRAMAFALEVAPMAPGVGVATGRIDHGGDDAASDVVITAASLASSGASPRVDRATVEALADRSRIVVQDDGRFAIRVAEEPTAQDLTPTPRAAFVGRNVEIATLVRSARRARDHGEVDTTWVLGPAGIGKTRLLSEAALATESELPETRVLRTRCDASHQNVPFAALRDALAGALGTEAVAFTSRVSSQQDAQTRLDRVRASFDDLLHRVADRGAIVIAVDDAQWIDAPSLEMLRRVGDGRIDVPAAVWFFARSEARDRIVGATLVGSVLDLAPLDGTDAAALLRSVCGEAPTAVLARAGGHPLFLEELGRLHRDGGGPPGELPVTIEAAALTQLDALDPSDRDYLKRAAIFGPTYPSGAPESLGANAACAARLKRSRWIDPPSRRSTSMTAFRSQVLQEISLSLWPADERAKLHARAAEWLAAQDGLEAAAALQWDGAGEPRQAAECYADAAVRSARAGDPSTTADLCRLALERTDATDVRWRALIARDDALQVAGDRGLQRDGLRELADLAEGLGLPHRFEAAWRMCYFARLVGDAATAVEHGERAVELAMSTGEPSKMANARIELAMVCAERGMHADARRHADQARRWADAAGDVWIAARSVATLAFVVANAGHQREALPLLEIAAESYTASGDRRRESVTRANVGATLLQLGRLDEAWAQLAASIEASLRVGNERSVAAATHNQGIVQRLRGDFEAAVALQDRAARAAAQLRHGRLEASVAIERAYLALASGVGIDERRALASAAIERALRTAAPPLMTSARAVALRCGAVVDTASEIEWLRGALERAEPADERLEILAALRAAASDGAAEALSREIDAVLARACVGLAGPDADDLRACLERRFEIAGAVTAREASRSVS